MILTVLRTNWRQDVFRYIFVISRYAFQMLAVHLISVLDKYILMMNYSQVTHKILSEIHIKQVSDFHLTDMKQN
jgi:hypothetical protein